MSIEANASVIVLARPFTAVGICWRHRGKEQAFDSTYFLTTNGRYSYLSNLSLQKSPYNYVEAINT